MTTTTEERLVETAARLFHEQGYHATGVASILRAAEANPGSFYHAFPSKTDLLRAVLDWYRDHLWPIVMGPVEEAQPDPIERVFDVLAWYRQGLVASEFRIGCPIGNLALELGHTIPEIRPLLDENFEGWADAILGWLDEAQDRLPAGYDRRSLSRFVLTVMEGGLMQARAAASIDPFDASVRVLRDGMDRLLRDGTGGNHPGGKT